MTDVTDNRLRLLIERVETINAEIKATQEDRKEVFAEMKAVGYDVKAVKEVIRLRAMKPEDRREMQMVLDTYCAAMGLA